VSNLRLQKQIVLNVAGCFCALVGILLNVTQLYLMAAILLLIPVVSYWVGHLLVQGLECSRSIPASCNEHEQVVVNITVRNSSWAPKFYLRAEDRLPEWLETGGFLSPIILFLLPGEFRQISYFLNPVKRGVYCIDTVHIIAADPLGFATYNINIPYVSEMLVYPSIVTLRRPFLDESAAQGWRGLELGRTRSSGLDFHGIRAYQPGDEVRRIHWATTARTGKLTVVESAQGSALDAVIALDLFKDVYRDLEEGPAGAIETAIKIAAAICADLLQRSQTVHLICCVGDEIKDVFAENSVSIPAILEALARAEPTATRPIAHVISERLDDFAAGATLVYITPDTGSAALSGVAEELEARGARIYGFGIVAESFLVPAKKAFLRTQRLNSGMQKDPGAPDFVGPGKVMPIKKNEDLVQAIEGLSSVRK
jgi:uncharacterized protein (DUF58 family)